MIAALAPILHSALWTSVGALLAVVVALLFTMMLRGFMPSAMAIPDQPLVNREVYTDIVFGVLIMPLFIASTYALTEGTVAWLSQFHGGGLDALWALRDAIGRLGAVWQFLLVVATYDFIQYWAHRVQHADFFWRFHLVHHSPKALDWTSTMRKHPLDSVAGFLPAVVVAAVLNMSMMNVVWFRIAYMVQQMFAHMNLRWTYGPLKYVVVSPVHHRWHHSADLEAPRNFGTFLSLWDYLFGTAYVPPGSGPARVGISETVPTTPLALLVYPLRPKAGRGDS